MKNFKNLPFKNMNILTIFEKKIIIFSQELFLLSLSFVMLKEKLGLYHSDGYVFCSLSSSKLAGEL